MSTDQPSPGSPDDPFAKPPQGDSGSGAPGGSPYDQQPPSTPPPGGPYGDNPYGGGPGGPYDSGPDDPFGGPPRDPLAGMPPLADSGRRLLARVIDVVIVLIPAGLLDWAAGGTDNVGNGKSALGSALFVVIGFLYEWLMTRATGQTVGKKLMKLRAAMLDNGTVPTDSAAALRALVLWLPAFCCSCIWFVILGLTAMFDKPYKQGLHDKTAKTVVVQTG
jgi:uncharacterized RDD family membrane protein YckC